MGCAIECWDADLNSAVPVDEPGELVCTKPFPSMPVRFWNDPEFQLYRAAYFDKIPGKFCIAITPSPRLTRIFGIPEFRVMRKSR